MKRDLKTIKASQHRKVRVVTRAETLTASAWWLELHGDVRRSWINMLSKRGTIVRP